MNSPEGQKWIPWFRRIFDEGLDLPVERPAELAVRLASGGYDALSGLTLTPRDDLDAILARLEEVERDKLYSMRLRTLPGTEAARVEAVRAVGTKARPDDLDPRIERHLNAGRAHVAGLWLDANAWARWFLPPAEAEWIEPPMVEAWPEGRILLAVRQRGLDYRLSGVFREIAVPEQLAFRWVWPADFPHGGPGDTEVTVEFHADGAGTRVILRQRGFANPGQREAHVRGWNRCFDEMGRILVLGG